ncbi:hypothetical protein [Cognatishimia activa]|uniref:Porin n=1 Tax=Cognatishimia activa TaxID=1715691 RepID=A0A0P1INJ3_9RHOB|nr:hypothetical protein [Cognatishimia activa]CUI26447.1 hypothetical protein TA5113_00015 [Cognatishimia activa]CUK25174.1 hypothetical protein TA5114_00964 [Cognatishimia activa]
MKYMKTFCLVALGFAPGALIADTSVFELDLGVAQDWRSGNALNSSGTGRELDEFTLGRVGGMAAFQFEGGFTLQGGFAFDHSFAKTTIDGFIPTNDTYAAGRQFNLQAGQHFDGYYLGAFVAAGRVAFNPWDDVQDADFKSYGLQLGWYGEDWSVSGTLGVLDSDADDPETLANAVLFDAHASYAVDDATSLNFFLSFADGEQDLDSGSAPDPVKVLSVGAEFERVLRHTARSSTSAYAGMSVISVKETSSSSFTDRVEDSVLSAGIRIQFGAAGVGQADRIKSPPLPEMLRILGAVPAVD